MKREHEPCLNTLLSRLCACAEDCLFDRLVGIYLHGSAAMGCFCWQTSDVDCLIVVDPPLTEAEKLRFVRECLDLLPFCPRKGLELSVVTRAACETPKRAPSFELHFSPLYAESYARNPQEQLRCMPETDSDLIAHFAMVRSRGRTLWGTPADTLFAPIPREWLLDSLENDLQDAKEQASQQPVYYILNYCRALAFLEEGKLLSKAEGGVWGQGHLPTTYIPLLQAALDAYGGKALFGAADYPVVAFIREMEGRWQKERGTEIHQ